MENKRVIVLIVIAVLVLTVKVFAGGAADFVPKDSILFIEIDNFKDFKSNFTRTNLYKLWNDPAMIAFTVDVEDKIKKQMADSVEIYDFITDPNLSPVGKAAAAVVLPDGQGFDKGVSLIFMAQFGDNLNAAAEKIKQIEQRSVNDGALKTKHTIEGVEITKITSDKTAAQVASPQEPNASLIIEGKKTEIAYCFVDDMLLEFFDCRDDLIGFAVSRVKGAKGRALSQDSNYIKTMNAVDAGKSFRIFVNTEAMVKSALASDQQGQGKMMFDNIGLMNLKGIGISVSPSPQEGVNAILKMFASIEGEPKGIFKILQFKTARVDVPGFVNPSANSFGVINWDAKSGYDEFYKMITAIYPQYAMMLNMPIPKQDGSGMISLADDVFAYFQPQIIFVENFGDGLFYQADTKDSGLIAVAINDKSKLQQSLASLHWMYSSMSGSKDLTKDFLGYTLYLFETAGAMPGDQDEIGNTDEPVPPIVMAENSNKRFGFVVTDTHLILAVQDELEKAVRLINNKQSSGLAGQKWFTQLLSTVPDMVGGASFKNDRLAAEAVWDTMRKLKTIAGPNVSPLGNGLDLSKLPEFEAVKKYFGLTSSYIISKPDGFYGQTKVVDIR